MFINIFDIFGHVANGLYTFGSNFKDILWLRIFIVLGASSEIFYSANIAANPLWTSVFWLAIIILVNSWHIIQLFKERTNLAFTDQELHIKKLIFPKMNSANFKKFIRTAEWKDIPRNQVIITENVSNNELMLIYKGMLAIKANGEILTYLRDGSFAGEISFLTGGKPTATVESAEPTTLIIWNKDNLKKLFDKSPELESDLFNVFSSDLIKKLIKKDIINDRY